MYFSLFFLGHFLWGVERGGGRREGVFASGEGDKLKEAREKEWSFSKKAFSE